MEGDTTFISVSGDNRAWNDVVELTNGTFEIQKLVLNNWGDIEVSLTDPSSNDPHHLDDYDRYWVWDTVDKVFLNDSFENIELRIDSTYGFDPLHFTNQFSSTYDITNDRTVISISGNSIQNEDVIIIDGKYGVVFFYQLRKYA